MHFRPATDSYDDYVTIRDMYNDWKEKQLTFTYIDYISYIQKLIDLQSILFVVTDDVRIIGSCKVLLEPKLMYGTYVCHVEDVVVHKDARHQGVGSFMLQTIYNYCLHNKFDETIRIYKMRLSCFSSLEHFYKRSKLEATGLDMTTYFENNIV